VNVSGAGGYAREVEEQPILIVDDHQLVGSSLVLALASRDIDANECPVTTTGDILRTAEERRSGLVLLDLELGVGLGGEPIDELELIVGLRARGWAVLVVSAATDERRIASAIAAGAIGYVPKAAPLQELLDVICRASSGRSVLPPEERARWLAVDKKGRVTDRKDRARWRRLTAREREVLDLLAHGDRAAAIAEQLCVSLTTVRAQIRSIHTKLDVNSQLEAVALLRRVQGIRAPEQGGPSG
jgi:DNA-binding NarL/FixJ family response regulator